MSDAPTTDLRVIPVPCLKDNYAYVIATQSGDAWVVDPSEAAPPAAALAEHGLTLKGILATHHHWDHTHGIVELVAMCGDAGTIVAGHSSDRERIAGMTHPVDAPPDRYASSGVRLGPELELLARHIPGHTTGAIAWLIPAAARAGRPTVELFTGDTLFAAGCGRLFEGTPEQMYASLQALTDDPALGDDSRLWFGHEYTAANLRFAAATEPGNGAIAERQRGLAERTTPTTVALERATNPFVRAGSASVFAQRRKAKDSFAG